MSTTTKSLRCLIVEDMEADAQLMLRQMRIGGYDVTSERVDTPEAMRAALARQPWDVVLSDYRMPRFSGLDALAILRESGIDLPFIIVSGTIGEEVAVAAMKAGVDDYLIKGELAHLTVAVERELRNTAARCERRSVAAALALNEAQFRAVFDHAPVGISLTLASKGVVLANAEHARITGVPVADSRVPGAFARASHPEDYARQMAAAEKFINSEVDHYTVEKRYLHPDGRVQWAELTSRFFTDPARNERWIVTILSDLNERKRGEEALQHNRDMLARTERIAQIGSWEWDVATDTVKWSEELFHMFQRNPADGAPSFAEHPSLYHPDDMAQLQRAVEAAVNKGRAFELELRANRAAGEQWICLARGHAEMGPDGKTTRLFGSTQDITERKQAEAAITRQLDELKRWHGVMLDREDRVQELKREVNELAGRLGEAARYPSQVAQGGTAPNPNPESPPAEP